MNTTTKTKTALGHELTTEFNHYSDCNDSTTTLKLNAENSTTPLCYATLSHTEQKLTLKVDHDNYLEIPAGEESPVDSLEMIAKQAQAITEFSMFLASSRKELFAHLAEYHKQAIETIQVKKQLAEVNREAKLDELLKHHPKLPEEKKHTLIADLERGVEVVFFVVYKHSLKAKQVSLRKLKSESGFEYIKNGKRKLSKLNALTLVLGARESEKKAN